MWNVFLLKEEISIQCLSHSVHVPCGVTLTVDENTFESLTDVLHLLYDLRHKRVVFAHFFEQRTSFEGALHADNSQVPLLHLAQSAVFGNQTVLFAIDTDRITQHIVEQTLLFLYVS